MITRSLATHLLRRLTHLASRGARELRHLERSSRFLLGLSEYLPRDDDVFISSYPRSGTTWVQLLAHLITRGGDLSFRHINEVVPWFERSLALGRCSAADFAERPSPRIYKSHLLPRWLPARGRYVYVCRDGLDVAVSYYALYRSHLGFEGSLDEFFERFLTGRLQYRSWFDHVRSWQAHRHEPRVLWLQYEQMRRQPEATLTRLAAFLQVPLSDARRRRILELSSLETMRAREVLFDHAADERFHRQVSRGQFVRAGEVGTGREALSEAQQAEFEVRQRRSRAHPQRLIDLPAFLH